MKIFETLKSDGNGAVKLFGIKVYREITERIINKSSLKTKRSQLFLGGLIKVTKTNAGFGYHTEKQIKVLGITFSKKVEQGDVKTKYFCGRIVKQNSSKEEFIRNCFEYFDNKYDDIYILNANSGEIYLFLTYLFDGYLKKNGSKTPLLVATKKYHLEIIKMVCPEIPAIYIDKSFINLKENKYIINNFRFFIIFCDFHFRKVEFDIKNNPLGKCHYFNSIKDYIDIPEIDINKRMASVPSGSEKSMIEKVSSTGLNLNNFVLIAPEAQSCELLPNQFWIDLIDGYHKAGVDVFVNLVGDSYDLSKAEFKNCFLTYSEVFALAQRSKKVISLRSGLTEFLLQTNVPIDVLYTKFRMRPVFKDMDSERVMSAFGIEKIPYINEKNLREFNVEQCDSSELISELLNVSRGKDIAAS